MAIKKRLNNFSTKDKTIAIENLANEFADRPYGESKENTESLERTTISLPKSLLFKLEDLAKSNKRNKVELRSVSALIRFCVEKYLQ